MTETIELEIITCKQLTDLPRQYYPFPKYRYATPAEAAAEALLLFGITASTVYDWQPPQHTDGKHGFWAVAKGGSESDG